MSWHEQGSRNMDPKAEYRAYDDSDDAYGAPKSRSNKSQQQYNGDRAQRFDMLLLNLRQRPAYRDESSYGSRGPADQGAYRAPYSTNPLKPGYDQQRQKPEMSQRGALIDRGRVWSEADGRYPGNTSGGAGRVQSAGFPDRRGGSRSRRSSGSGAGSGCNSGGSHGGNRRAGSAGSGGSGARYLSNGRANGGQLPSGSHLAVARNAGGSASTSRGSSRTRAPYMTAGRMGGQPGQSAADADMDAPSNPHFITPAFPQAPRTRTDSCNTWALMIEAASQTLEAVVGPLLEGVLMELFGESWERELYTLGLSLPPFTAATCVELVGRCKQLHERLPITIHKRVEAVGKATAALSTHPAALEPEDVTAAHTAMKGMLQDCIKAIKLPSLLGSGSRQFRAFTSEWMPHAESNLVYYEMLILDCAEASTARQQARTAGFGELDVPAVTAAAAQEGGSP